MNYGAAELTLASYLNERFAALNLSEKFFAAAMPETDKEMKDFEAQIQKTRVAVEYVDSDFQDPTDVQIVRQAETLRFRFTFDGKRMRGEGGLFTMINLSKFLLLGYRLPDADPMYLTAYGKTQFENGVWMPHLEFACKTMNVQVFRYPGDEIGGPYDPGTLPPFQFTREFTDEFL